MCTHVDQMCSCARRVQRTQDDRVGRSYEAEHGAIGGLAAIYIQQPTTHRRRYRVHDRIDHLFRAYIAMHI